MKTNEIWPMLFEMEISEPNTMRSRTFFVTIEQDGTQHWLDHTGRMTRIGGMGGFSFRDGEIVHIRGDREISKEEEQNEKEEFVIKVSATEYDSDTVVGFVTKLGKPWIAGWAPENSTKFHELLKLIYWKSVNHLAYEPFDNEKGA